MSGGGSMRSGAAAMSVWATDDARVDSSLSYVGWAAGFFFSFRAILVFISARWLNAGTEPGVFAAFAMSAVLLIAALVQGFGGAAQPLGAVWKIAGLRWVLIYLAFSACSLLWTGAASPVYSALYWCALAADVAIVLCVFRGSSARQAGHSLMKGFICGSTALWRQLHG